MLVEIVKYLIHTDKTNHTLWLQFCIFYKTFPLLSSSLSPSTISILYFSSTKAESFVPKFTRAELKVGMPKRSSWRLIRTQQSSFLSLANKTGLQSTLAASLGKHRQIVEGVAYRVCLALPPLPKISLESFQTNPQLNQTKLNRSETKPNQFAAFRYKLATK